MLRTLQQFANRFQGFAAEMRDSALELVLPSSCRLCGESVASNLDFCLSCEQTLAPAETMMTDACRRCGRPQSTLIIATAAASTSSDGESATDVERAVSVSQAALDPLLPVPLACRNCVSETYEFDDVVALWPYQDKICEVVVASKYSSRVPLADALGRRLGRCVAQSLAGPRPDLVTYVPSHFTRQAMRGGTSTRVIAEGVSRTLGVKCQGVIRMTRRINKQAWLNDSARVENVRDAFTLRHGNAFRGLPDLTDRHILLVDDVLTTGATASELSRVLRAGGARKISLAVVARALRT